MKRVLTSKKALVRQHPRAHERDSTANFRNESIGNLYPDGARAMSLFRKSTAKIHEQLELLEAFMSDQSTVCERCLDGMKTLADRRTVKAAEDLASRWFVYTGETMKTIQAITKVCDAIMIEAVGAPKSTEPSLRVGGSPEGASLEQSWVDSTTQTLHNSKNRLSPRNIRY
jgi:hypothetical protein